MGERRVSGRRTRWGGPRAGDVPVWSWPDSNREGYQRLRWKFAIDDPAGPQPAGDDGVTTIGETGAKPVQAADCVLWVWAQEVSGQELPNGFRLDTDDLHARKVQVRIAHRHYQKDGSTRTRRRR